MLELYQFEMCPFCRKVRDKLEELDLDYIIRSTRRSSKKRKALMDLGGKDQVPFLVDMEKNVFMYEYNDIMDYLESTNRKK